MRHYQDADAKVMQAVLVANTLAEFHKYPTPLPAPYAMPGTEIAAALYLPTRPLRHVRY